MKSINATKRDWEWAARYLASQLALALKDDEAGECIAHYTRPDARAGGRPDRQRGGRMNPYETHRRHLKAVMLSDVILAAYSHIETDIPCSEVARGMTPAERAKAADAAKVNMPSDETWAVVVTMIERRENVSRGTEAVA